MYTDWNIILALDIGIGSIGWCLLRYICDTESGPVYELLASSSVEGQIVPSLGVRCMKVPEDTRKKLLNAKRREARGIRRVIKRRAKRMKTARALFLPILGTPVLPGMTTNIDPWTCRAEGLTRQLSREELASVFLHLCKHRGFKSNSKSVGKNSEEGKVLSAISVIRKDMEEKKSLTFGEYMFSKAQKRNRCGFDGSASYNNIPLRALLEEETRILFQRQRKLGNTFLTSELENRFIDIAFTQRPMAPTTALIGRCTFLSDEKRAPKFAYTSEKFRLVQRLCNLRIKEGGTTRPLSSSHIEHVLMLLGESATITYKTLRKRLKLSPAAFFEGIGTGTGKNDPESKDIITKSKGGIPGSYALGNCLGRESFARLRDLVLENGHSCLDRIAAILSEHEDTDSIRKELTLLPLYEEEMTKLEDALQEGCFSGFKGTMNLSLKAMSIILPEMIACGDYAKGCEMAGFDHAKEKEVNLDDVRNPVVLKILRETRKQVQAIIREFGVVPGRVHIELLREVGKSAEERMRIEKGQKDRQVEKDRLRQQLAEALGKPLEKISAKELRRYELWRQQGNKCAYYQLLSNSGEKKIYSNEFKEGGIPITALDDESHMTEIDHILPYSRTSDNSFHNQCLCLKIANQKKGNRTPYEWIGKDSPVAWHAHTQWVNSLSISGFKKRNLLMENLDADKEKRFHERNLHDSSYAARLVMQLVRKELDKFSSPFENSEEAGKRRIFARPGSVTAFLRHKWGVNGLKYRDGQRVGDKHHALDALVLAVCKEGLFQRITRYFQGKIEYQDMEFPTPTLLLPPEISQTGPLPFRQGCALALEHFMVSRGVRTKIGGALHKETMRAMRQEKDSKGNDVTMLYERKSVAELTKESLKKIKDAHRCPALIAALEDWIDKGKPKDEPPRVIYKSKKDKNQNDINTAEEKDGGIVRHVKIQSGQFTSGLIIPRGGQGAQVETDSWARADIYTKGGKYYMVPVFTWQEACGEVPLKAIDRGKHEKDWPVMDESYDYLFSLSPDAYVVAERGKELKQGYYLGSDKTTAAITLADANDRTIKMRGIGVKTQNRLEKYWVDRMGRIHKAAPEKRPVPLAPDRDGTS